MAVRVENVMVQREATLKDRFVFDIQLECIQEVSAPLVFKVTYALSSRSADPEQLLADVDVGPVRRGISRFILRAKPVDMARVAPDELAMGALFLSGLYREQQFVRVGYFVRNDVPEDASPAEVARCGDIRRTLLVDDVTITRFSISWE